MPAGCIRERNGRFYVRTRALVIDPHNGSSRWRHIEKAAGTSRRRAERMLRTIQDDVDDGRYIPSNVTVLELGQRWLTEHVEPNLKPATAANYRQTLYQHIGPALGTDRLDDLHPQMIRSLLGKKRAEGLSEETVAKIRRHTHAMLAFAQDAGLLSVNPADTARARGGHTPRRRARGTQLSPVQIKRFLDECSPRWRAFFTVAIDTGLRRGELIGLRWEDIDLLQRILHVRRSVSSYDQAGDGRTGGAHDEDRGRAAARPDPRRRTGNTRRALRQREGHARGRAGVRDHRAPPRTRRRHATHRQAAEPAHGHTRVPPLRKPRRTTRHDPPTRPAPHRHHQRHQPRRGHPADRRVRRARQDLHHRRRVRAPDARPGTASRASGCGRCRGNGSEPAGRRDEARPARGCTRTVRSGCGGQKEPAAFVRELDDAQPHSRTAGPRGQARPSRCTWNTPPHPRPGSKSPTPTGEHGSPAPSAAETDDCTGKLARVAWQTPHEATTQRS